MENIKAKINIHWEGQSKPFASAEDFEILKGFFGIGEDSEYETLIQDILVESERFKIADINISVLKETREDHMKYGVDVALGGEPMPYNLRVSIYLKRK